MQIDRFEVTKPTRGYCSIINNSIKFVINNLKKLRGSWFLVFEKFEDL